MTGWLKLLVHKHTDLVLNGLTFLTDTISAQVLLAGTNPCAVNNGGCEELCLFNGTAAVCKCAHGQVVDNTKCKGQSNKTLIL